MDSSNCERNLTEPITLDNQIKIHKCWEAICRDLDLKFLSPNLIAHGILTADESREILLEGTLLKQNEKFLHLMLKGDNHTYENLLSCLQDDYEWLAKRLAEYEVNETDRKSHIDSIKKLCALPQKPACFTGRSGDVQKVRQLLLGGHRLVNIKAFGGQGKTALATVIGHQFVSTWGIRSVMVDLKNVHTEEDVLREVLFALRPSTYGETEGRTTVGFIQKICREVSNYDKKILVIFDNCESALNVEGRQTFLALLTKLNSNCRNALVLCTSRDAIVLPSMVVTEHPLESLSKEASVTLLRSYRGDLESVDGETLAAKCGFMALLLHTVGVLLSWGCSAAELLNELAESPFTLKTDVFDFHRCIDLTYRRLKLNEKTAFQLLSFFPSTFTSAQAIELLKKNKCVARTTNIEYSGLLQTLYEMSFLNFDATKKTYAMHSLIQFFAKHGIPTESADAYRLSFISFMKPNITNIVDVEMKKASLIFASDRENFVQCIDIFSELTSKSQKRIYSTMRKFASCLQNISRFDYALRCYKALLEVQQHEKDADEVEIAHLLMQIGLIYSWLNNVSESRYKLESAVDIYEKLKTTYNNRDYHCCCYHLAVHFYRESRFLESFKWIDKCSKTNINSRILRQRDQSFIALIKAKQGEKGEVMDILQEILESDPELDGRPGGVDGNAISNAAVALRTIGKTKESLLLFNRSFLIEQAALGEHINTARTLDNTGESMLSIGDADGAVNAFQRALSIREKIQGEQHESTASTIHELARAMSAKGKHVEALSTYQRALRIKEEVLGENASTALTLYNIGQEMLIMGDPAGAVKSFQRALDIREKIHGEHHTITADTIHELARAMSVQGKHDEALSTFQRALRIKEEVLGESATSAFILNNIGREMLIMGDTAGATNAFQRAVDIKKEIHAEHRESTACTIHSLARAMSSQGKHIEALNTYQRALGIEEKVLGESANTATTLHNLGVEMLTTGDVDGAVNAFKRALAMKVKIHGEHHESTANTIHELARAMSVQGKHAEALSTYQRALCIKEEVLGGSPSTATTLHGIGLEMRNMDNADGAVNAFQRALVIREKVHGEQHKSTACTIHELARAMSAQGNHDKALITYQRALRIYEEVLGESASTATTLHCIGLEMLTTGDADGAVNALQKALVLKEKIYGEHHESTAVTIHELARAISSQGKHVEALSTYHRALRIMDEVLGESTSTANTLYNIGQEMLNAARTVHSLGSDGIKSDYIESALFAFRKALGMRKKILGEYHDLTADTTHALGVTLFEQGHFSKSLSTLRKVLLIYEQAGMIETRNTVVVMENIADAMKATEDTDGAISMYRRALDLSRVLGDDEQTLRIQNKLFEIRQGVGHGAESKTPGTLQRVRHWGRKKIATLKEKLVLSKTAPNGS